jgi:hypothetical protein
MLKFARFLLAASFLALAFAARAADPVAFVSDFKGEVAMNGAGRPAFLAELIPGTKLVLGPEAAVAVMYVVSGEEYSLKGPGEFVVAKDGVKATKGAAPTTRAPAIRPSPGTLVQTSKTATASLRMRSAPGHRPDRAGALYPVNAKIATLQPTLRWKGEQDAAHAVVVTSVAGKEVYRGTAKGNSLRLPVRLAAGQGYEWTSSRDGALVAEARFETLPADAIAAADKARAAAKSFPDRVLLAMSLQDLGATQDAKELWAQLASERPDIPELAGLAR